jgi:hypothetical protein
MARQESAFFMRDAAVGGFMLFRRTTPQPTRKLIWRIYSDAPRGERVDSTSTAVLAPETAVPDLTGETWASSSFDLVYGTEVREIADTVPAELLDGHSSLESVMAPTGTLRRNCVSKCPVGMSPRKIAVHPHELEGRLERLRDEIAAHEGSGERNEARLARMACELDNIDQEFAAFCCLVLTAPTLHDVVERADQSAARACSSTRRNHAGAAARLGA